MESEAVHFVFSGLTKQSMSKGLNPLAAKGAKKNTQRSIAMLYSTILVTKFIFLVTDIYPLSNFPQGGIAPALQSGSFAKLAHWASSLRSAPFPRGGRLGRGVDHFKTE
jgi:hypothetical protein